MSAEQVNVPVDNDETIIHTELDHNTSENEIEDEFTVRDNNDEDEGDSNEGDEEELTEELTEELVEETKTEETKTEETKTDDRGVVVLDGESLSIQDVINVALNNYSIRIDANAIEKVKEAHKVVLDMVKNDVIAYGVTTGFGALGTVNIKQEEACQLSRNIVVSHACCVDDPMPKKYVKAGIVVRINALIKGHSGVSMDTIDAMAGLLNHNIIPVIPNTGSLACSGDLAPLSHMALVISRPISENDLADNDVYYNGEIMSGTRAMELAGVKRSLLGPKEGLAITNGSTFTAGIACIAYYYADRIYKQTLGSLALTSEAILAVGDAFDADVHKLRNQIGQIECAGALRLLLEGSKLVGSSGKIQDAYSIRCALQVQGVLYDRLEEFSKMLIKEINAVTDNPILVKQNNIYKFVSGGNFHGSIIGQYAESIKVALTQYSTISERRMDRILSDKSSNGLPAMLIDNPGLNSGYMIAQYTSASLALKNQKLSYPDSVLTIPTCMNYEDHNSNSYNAVISLMEIINNTFKVVAIETLLATRGLNCRFRASNTQNPVEDKILGKFGKTVYNNLVSMLYPSYVDHPMKIELDKFITYTRSDEYINSIDKIINQITNEAALANAKGARDFHPEEMAVRRKVMDQIRDILIRHGAGEIDTPVFEHRTTLLGRYGDASRKLVFDLDDQGGVPLTLRFDLTVPFSKYMALYNKKAMKRFHCGKVYRRDNPVMSKGRYREFFQFDFDIAGDFDVMTADAEVLQIVHEVLSSFKFNFTIKVNHKVLLELLFEVCGIPPEKYETAGSSIDKLDKSPWEYVERELLTKGLSRQVVNKINDNLRISGEPMTVLNDLKTKHADNERIQAVLGEIELLFNYLQEFGCLQNCVFDLSVIRGLAYYTGMIYEAVLLENGSQMGSISAGGRYDDLIGAFTNGRKIPAVGCSFGIERIFTLLQERENKEEKTVNSTKCYVTFFRDRENEQMNKKLFLEVLSISKELWAGGVSTVYVTDRKEIMKAQIINTVAKRIPFMIQVGENELKDNKVVFKDLNAENKKPKTILRNEIVQFVKNYEALHKVSGEERTQLVKDV